MTEINLKYIKYDWQLTEIVRKGMMPNRYCPECKEDMPMARLSVTIKDSLRNTRFGKRTDEATRFRCMGCLALWDEYEGRINL